MRKSASFFTGLVFALAVAGCNGYDKVDYSLTLNSTNEAAGVVTVPETGTGTFTIEFDGPAANWTLVVTPLVSGTITASHIHEAAAGVSGGIMVYLYDGPATGTTPVSSGTFKGSFINDQVLACTPGCLAGNGRTYDAIVADAANHNGYVNVHTTGNGGGAIRGNF